MQPLLADRPRAVRAPARAGGCAGRRSRVPDRVGSLRAHRRTATASRSSAVVDAVAARRRSRAAVTAATNRCAAPADQARRRRRPSLRGDQRTPCRRSQRAQPRPVRAAPSTGDRRTGAASSAASSCGVELLGVERVQRRSSRPGGEGQPVRGGQQQRAGRAQHPRALGEEPRLVPQVLDDLQAATTVDAVVGERQALRGWPAHGADARVAPRRRAPAAAGS